MSAKQPIEKSRRSGCALPGLVLSPHRLADSRLAALMATQLASRAFSDPALPGFALSTALGGLFKPGESIHAVLYAFASMLKTSYRAAKCIIALRKENATQGYTSEPCDEAKYPYGRPVDSLFPEASFLVQSDLAVLYSSSDARLSRRKPVCRFFDGTTLEVRTSDAGATARLVDQLGSMSLMSVPLPSRSQALGRLYLLRSGARYSCRDLRTLVQLARQAGPSIESMLLVERLSQTVATQERRRISRDLHDGTIQPYIGLKLGLEALRRTLPEADRTAREIDELIVMAGDGIMQLRRYVGRLQSGSQPAQAGRLLPALRHQAEKFTQYDGIRAEVVGPEDLVLGARLHEEVLYMVREALSNVRRHTRARRAAITVLASACRLVVEVRNDRAGAAKAWHPFRPHSLAERAEDLGGAVRVERRDGGHTAVVIGLPL